MSISIVAIITILIKILCFDFFQVDLLSNKEEFSGILADLSSMVTDEEVVLVITFGNYDEIQPGTLPEEKVRKQSVSFLFE